MGFNSNYWINQLFDFNINMSKLHVDSVTKSYNNKIVLSDVFLSCQKGEIKGLIGRNGSGKSTLLKIIFGTENADYKFVRAGNKVIKNIFDGRQLINYLPQDNFLPNNISIKSLIHLFLHKENRNIVLENDYVKPLLNKKNQNLSGGERRIIEILLIIHSNADFILLDEPFNGVSPLLIDSIKDLIREKSKTKGIILTDHDYTNVLDVATRYYLMRDGGIKKIKNKNDLVTWGYLVGPKN